jgi:gamma-glutamyltranspeptidase/glutathione hydrolase
MNLCHSIARVALTCWLVFFWAAAQACGIASAHPLATKAGCDVLLRGGNAFDAAVAVGAALAVVEPYASGLGGGGFFLLHRASDGLDVFLDARETAPRLATQNLYVDEKGALRGKRISEGATAAGIPGEPAAFAWLARRYGSRPLAELLAPAIELAERGFATDARFASAAGVRADVFKRLPDAAMLFLDGGQTPAAGYQVRQTDLARTLRALAAGGHAGFYEGAFAQRLVDAVQKGEAVWELDDLRHYQVVEREPLRFAYRGARITTAPMPSSGGLVLAQALQILERYPMAELSAVARAHLSVEALRRGFQDRVRWMGDPAFVDVPVARLLSRSYADERARSIQLDRATPSNSLDLPVSESQHTTHFSVVDRAGNRVAATLSVNGPFGSGFIAGDTGILLNNHMADFSFGLASDNTYSLGGGTPNSVQAGKRPVSSMSPTFVEDSRGVLVFGTPGGSRIISMMLLGILEYVDGAELDLKKIVSLPRFHHQYLPDRIEFEPGEFNGEWQDALRERGHVMQEGKRKWGNMQLVFVDRVTGEIRVESDPRGKTGVMF